VGLWADVPPTDRKRRRPREQTEPAGSWSVPFTVGVSAVRCRLRSLVEGDVEPAYAAEGVVTVDAPAVDRDPGACDRLPSSAARR
jgi:hypothetical protein